jgi:hypothetical protein
MPPRREGVQFWLFSLLVCKNAGPFTLTVGKLLEMNSDAHNASWEAFLPLPSAVEVSLTSALNGRTQIPFKQFLAPKNSNHKDRSRLTRPPAEQASSGSRSERGSQRGGGGGGFPQEGWGRRRSGQRGRRRGRGGGRQGRRRRLAAGPTDTCRSSALGKLV